MKRVSTLKYLLLFLIAFSCGSDSRTPGSDPVTPGPIGDEVVKPDFNPMQVTSHDGKPFSTGVATPGGTIGGPGGVVMMQAFYWDVPMGGTWWDIIKSKTKSWSDAGIGAIWLPPVSKGMSGGFSMGYDPYDYYDFGNFEQHGTVETRFGSKDELVALITEAHGNRMLVYADIVLNHNSGGSLEYNPYMQKDTWTDFTGVKSGLFKRNYEDFHKNAISDYDEGSFGEMPDLSHKRQYVQDWLWKKPESVAQYYKNTMKFDGWRFDYVKGFGTWVIKDFMASAPGFAVAENWDGNPDVLEQYTNATGINAFDFSTYYKMKDAFDGRDLNKLKDDMFWKRQPYKAVTFVTNHDTDEITAKNYAYAYILTHEGYPTIFYRDYEEWLNKGALNKLISIHNELATGNTTIMYVDNDEYIMRRNGYNGNPGLILYINMSNSVQEKWVESNWVSKEIKDHTGNAANWNPTTRSDKWVRLKAPAGSYSVYSLK